MANRICRDDLGNVTTRALCDFDFSVILGRMMHGSNHPLHDQDELDRVHNAAWAALRACYFSEPSIWARYAVTRLRKKEAGEVAHVR
jgi:hypothetical protein